jgi:hypothetical protein
LIGAYFCRRRKTPFARFRCPAKSGLSISGEPSSVPISFSMSSPSLNIDRSQNESVNLSVLQRRDSNVIDILATCSHVVIYEFDGELQEWKRKEVEGCLFFVKRYTSPRYQIVVSNRLSTDNLVLTIDSSLELQNSDEFLILKTVCLSTSSSHLITGRSRRWAMLASSREYGSIPKRTSSR